MSSSQNKTQPAQMSGSSDSETENRERGPAKRAKINIPCMEEGSLLSLLANPRFSDVKVIVGEERIQYDLHRAIICLQSTFFEAACKEGFIEGNTREINLPDIQPEAFETIAKWLYNGGFSIKEQLSTERFCELYKATDFLGVDSLKRAMMSTVAKSLEEDVQKKPADSKIENPMHLIHSITQVAPMSDWQALRQVTDKVVPHRQIPASSLRSISDAPYDINGFFSAVLIDSYQEFTRSVLCGSCIRQVRNNSGRCLSCRKGFQFQKREGPPQKSESST